MTVRLWCASRSMPPNICCPCLAPQEYSATLGRHLYIVDWPSCIKLPRKTSNTSTKNRWALNGIEMTPKQDPNQHFRLPWGRPGNRRVIPAGALWSKLLMISNGARTRTGLNLQVALDFRMWTWIWHHSVDMPNRGNKHLQLPTRGTTNLQIWFGPSLVFSKKNPAQP